MRAALLCVLLAGCATSAGPNMKDMTPEQLRALTADKNFTAICSTITGAGGQAKFVYSNVDKTMVTNGSITVAPDCTVTMSNQPNPPRLP